MQRVNKIEELLKQAEPILVECGKLADEALKLPNLPEYMGQKIHWLGQRNDDFLAYQRERIKGIRQALPKEELAKEQKRFEQWCGVFQGDTEKAQQAMLGFK